MRTNKNGMLPNRRIRIPFVSKAEHHAPIRDCVVRAAERAGIEPVQMAIFMSYFLEEVGEEMISRRIVRIPGFGAFGAKTRFRRVTSKHFGNGRVCYPAFVPCSSLKLHVRMRVRPALTPATDAMRRLARNNSYRKIDGSKSSGEVFENFRRALMNHNDDSARSRRQRIA